MCYSFVFIGFNCVGVCDILANILTKVTNKSIFEKRASFSHKLGWITYFINMGYILPTSILSCVLTSLFRALGALQTRALALHLDSYLELTENQDHSPKAKTRGTCYTRKNK